MYIALALMFLGLLLGRLLGGFVKVELSKCILVVISLLLMVLGIELGFNEQKQPACKDPWRRTS